LHLISAILKKPKLPFNSFAGVMNLFYLLPPIKTLCGFCDKRKLSGLAENKKSGVDVFDSSWLN
jgi:hypothetical protein